MTKRIEAATAVRNRSTTLADISRATMVSIAVNNPEKGIAAGFTCSFIRYQATQGYRITDWLEKANAEETDLLAHATRGLFESLLIYRHLMNEGQERFVTRLIREVRADEFDLMQGLIAKQDLDNHSPEFKQHYLNLESLKLKKTPQTKQLVENEKDLILKEQYKKYYRQYSKYTHPSLYQIAGPYEKVFSSQVMVVFANHAISYLDQAVANAEIMKNLVSR